MLIHALLIFSLLNTAAITTSEASVVDFCVADILLPHGPAGYSCKNPALVRADDFVYRLRGKGNFFPLFGVYVNPAFAPIFPGANGLGISMIRTDYNVNSTVPFHTHPGATEMILVTSGTLSVGFVASSGKPVYQKTLTTGDVMVIPQGLLHFQQNIGKVPAVTFSSFSSDRPGGELGAQVLDFALFGNDLPTDTVVSTTLIAQSEVQRLKTVFGGTN